MQKSITAIAMALCAALLPAEGALASEAGAQNPIGDAFMVKRVYGGADGESHIDAIALPRTGGEPGKSVQ